MLQTLVTESVKIECGANQHQQREEDDQAAYHLIDNKDAVGVKLFLDLVDEPCQSKPPQQRTHHNAHIAQGHLDGMVGHDKGKLGEGTDEQKDDEGIGECDKKRGDAIVKQRPLLVAAAVHLAGGIGAETADAENQQDDASDNLQPKLVGGIGDEVHDKTHAQTRQQRIDDIAHGSTDAGDKSVRAPFVQGALYAQHAYRSHRSGRDDADEHTLQYQRKDIYLKWKSHIVCKFTKLT